MENPTMLGPLIQTTLYLIAGVHESILGGSKLRFLQHPTNQLPATKHHLRGKNGRTRSTERKTKYCELGTVNFQVHTIKEVEITADDFPP